MVTHTISVTELVWTLFCGVGLFFNAKLLLGATRDLNELRARQINHLREYSARLAMFAYGMLTIVQFGFVLIGAGLMFIPPAPHTRAVSAGQLLIAVTFLLISAILAVGSFIQERGRQALIKKIVERENGR